MVLGRVISVAIPQADAMQSHGDQTVLSGALYNRSPHFNLNAGRFDGNVCLAGYKLFVANENTIDTARKGPEKWLP